jgi:hypothetical protein
MLRFAFLRLKKMPVDLSRLLAFIGQTSRLAEMTCKFGEGFKIYFLDGILMFTRCKSHSLHSLTRLFLPSHNSIVKNV